MPVSYRHIIYIHFPYLAASRIQRTSGQRASGANLPLVIIRKINGADIVVAGCTKAAAHALAAGMRLADARALCPQLRTETHDPLADHADLHHLALWARRYSPLTAIDDQHCGIWIDIAGAEHLFGGVRSLLADSPNAFIEVIFGRCWRRHQIVGRRGPWRIMESRQSG